MVQDHIVYDSMPDSIVPRPNPNKYYGWVTNNVELLANDDNFCPEDENTWPQNVGLCRTRDKPVMLIPVNALINEDGPSQHSNYMVEFSIHFTRFSGKLALWPTTNWFNVKINLYIGYIIYVRFQHLQH